MNIYFSENLKQLRTQRNLTQEALANFLNVSFQAISKWERGENFPDIETLVNIAIFFKVSVDDLLGVNKIENEEEIEAFVTEYDNYLNDGDKQDKLVCEMMKKYPTDFRVQLRYLGNIMFRNNGKDHKEYLSEIQSIYNNIQNNCTNDTIRICSKRYLAAYYNTLSYYEDSGITHKDCEQIISEMPHMRDGQEFLRSYLYPHNTDEWKGYVLEAIEEEIGLLCHGLTHYAGAFLDNSVDINMRLYALSQEINLINSFYDDGNYGRMWRVIVYNYGHLGHVYFELGDKKKAIENLRISAELAKKFDNMDRFTTMHSKLFEGREFDKETLGSTYVASSRMKLLMTERYPLSDEFKQTEEFKEILKILS